MNREKAISVLVLILTFGLGLIVGSTLQSPTVVSEESLFSVFSKVPGDWVIFTVATVAKKTNSGQDQVDIFYLPPNQSLMIPELMSNYSFIMIRNNPPIGSNFSFAEDYFGSIGAFENELLRGKFFNDLKGGAWLWAEFKTGNNTLIAHASSKEKVIELINQAGPIASSPSYPSTTLEEVPRRLLIPAGTLDPSGKYRYYLPPSYVKQPKEPTAWNWSTPGFIAPLLFLHPEMSKQEMSWNFFL